MRLYFAHNFDNRREFREWELEFEERTGVELLNPFYDAPEKKEQMELLDSEEQTSEQRLNELRARTFDECCDIVYADLARLAYCDGLFTIIESVSFGTTCEICDCRASAKPVFVVSEKHQFHPWLRVYATQIWPDLRNFELSIRNGELECPDWTKGKPPVSLGSPQAGHQAPSPGLWRGVECPKCESTNWYPQPDEDEIDLSGIDVEALRCWACKHEFFVCDPDLLGYSQDTPMSQVIVDDGAETPGA